MKMGRLVESMPAVAAGLLAFGISGVAGAAPPWVAEGSGTPSGTPAGLVVRCMKGPTSSELATSCPVMHWNGHTYWAYSFADGRESLAIVAFDPAGKQVGRWDRAGARDVNAVTIDGVARTATFVGRDGKKIAMTWDQLYPLPRVEAVSVMNFPAVPPGMKVACTVGPNSAVPLSTTCPVIRWGGYTYWPLAFTDGRKSVAVVAYDGSGAAVRTWTIPGTTNIHDIKVGADQRMYFHGLTNFLGYLTFAELFPPGGARWEKVATPPVTFKQITVGNAGYVWALDTSGTVWKYNGTGWIQGACCVTLLSATGDNTLWAVNGPNSNAALRYDNAGKRWLENVTWGMTRISAVNATTAWGTDAIGSNHLWNGTAWEKKGCCTMLPEAGSDGALWAAHPPNLNAVMRWTGTGWVNTSPEGVTIAKGMTMVSVGDAKTIWALDGQGKPHSWINGWRPMNGGPFKDISAAADGTVWAMDAQGQLFRWFP